MGRRAAIVVILAGTLTACLQEHAAHALRLDSLWRTFRSDATPPPADAPGWERVSLPDFWGVAIRRHDIAGWFRATVPLDAVPSQPWAIYLPRIGQNVTAWVNGVPIGDGGRMTDPLPRNWNRPLLLTVPPSLLQAGENVIALHLVTHRGAPGYLRPFFFGPLDALRPLYARRAWWQVSFAQIVGGSTLAGGLLLLAFSLRASAFAAVRWIALALVLWAWSTADAFVREIPVPTRLWEWSTASALVWCPIAFVLGLHRLLGQQRPRLERGMALVAGGATVLLLVIPDLYFFSAMLAVVSVALAMAIYVMVRAAPLLGEQRGRAVLLVALIVVVVGLHDVVAAVTGTAPLGAFFSPYLPVMAIALVAWRLLGVHLASVEETAALNRTLEHRVAEKHRELARNYERLHGLEREHAVAAERERIMQDVHDGVGGQLVSALALVESGTHGPEEVSDVLRGALDDLRLVIDSLEPVDCDLLAVLGSVRARLEPRLQRHGLTMRWEVREVPALPGFGPEMALQVMRLVQEAVTNVVRHAAARTIVVRTGDGADGGQRGVFVEIRDDGRGLRAGAPRGRGLTGMERRAERLGGRLVIDSSETGTTVRVWIPLERP